MGQKQPKQVQSIRGNEFYQACRDGNINRVRQLLPSLTYEDINYIDSASGYTPLHIACSNNHHEIVRLLLENKACNRIIPDNDGKTAFDKTAIPNARSLFARQNNRTEENRFVDTTSDHSSFQHSMSNTASTDCPDSWLRGYASVAEATESQLMLALSQSSNPLMKVLLKNLTERESRHIVHQLIFMHIPMHHPDHKIVLHFYYEFLRTKSVDPLLTLYSLETPFYGVLQSNADAYTILLYMHLNELRKRAFRGDTYRGATMLPGDIVAYRWANVRSAILQTRTLQSTSRSLDVASSFARVDPANSARLSVIIRFKFTETCPTAIDLDGLSYFPGEEEVILLPFTLFKVASIKQRDESTNQQYEIVLQNVPVPHNTLWSSSFKMKK